MEKQEPLFMIVDDEPDMCWALENILKKNGYHCEKALSGREAMKLVKSAQVSIWRFLTSNCRILKGWNWLGASSLWILMFASL